MDPAPKVLILDLSNHYGGASSRVLGIMGRARSGMVGLAGLKSGAITSKAVRASLPVHILAHHKASPLILPRLISLIRREGYNVLDSQNIQSKFWANLAALATGTALVSTINSWYANEHGQLSIRGRIYTALELATNQSLDLYVTVSEHDRRLLIRSGLPADSIELIHNAVEVDTRPGSENLPRSKTKLNLPPEAIVCVAVGRLVPVKGFDVLISAFGRIASRFPKMVCLIVGEGEARPQLEQQIERAGLQAQIRLVGYHDHTEVLSILETCDIFVMPSRYEGTPVALLEAAALARPIIASACGGIPELVTSGEQAVLVTPGEPEVLAEALARLATDREFASLLGRKAQERVRREFNVETQFRATWNAYLKALRRHNGQVG